MRQGWGQALHLFHPDDSGERGDFIIHFTGEKLRLRDFFVNPKVTQLVYMSLPEFEPGFE